MPVSKYYPRIKCITFCKSATYGVYDLSTPFHSFVVNFIFIIIIIIVVVVIFLANDSQVDSGFQTLLNSGFHINVDSGFQSAGFQIPMAKISWIPDSEFCYMGRLFIMCNAFARLKNSFWWILICYDRFLNKIEQNQSDDSRFGSELELTKLLLCSIPFD